MPRNVVVKSISFQPDELAVLDEMAKADGRSRSQQVNYLIRKAREPHAVKIGATEAAR